jgi:imidazolonepropionase-like amidohydrolase/Tol biopolymer transport system component
MRTTRCNRSNLRRVIYLVLLAGWPGALCAQTEKKDEPKQEAKKDETKKEEPKKEEGLPLKPTRKIEFTTDEGTWISLDVSPDGKQIVFDLLGDLYLLPIAGGEAKRLTSGLPWDCQPRFSPDGKQIAFISYRGGSDNIWLLDVASGKFKVVTQETDWQLGSPAWTPDGNYLVARKFGPYPTPDDFIRGVALWMYHKDGGKGVELVKGRGDTAITTGASFAPDGRLVYFSSHAGRFQYDEQTGRFQVNTFDRITSEVHTITSEYGGGLRPIVSPDGHYLVYGSRHDAVTGLRVRDLKTQDEHWLVNAMQRDDQQGFGANDVLPGYSFTPDSKSVVYTSSGHVQKVDVATKQVVTIPFTAKVELDLGPRIRTAYKVSDGPLNARQLRWMNSSPDGKRVVFGAVGKIWLADLAAGPSGTLTAGKLRRLTSTPVSAGREYEPIFSPDGKWVAYESWSDAEGGQLWKAPVDGGAPVRLTTIPAHYATPRWSPDGEKLVFVMSSARGYLTEQDAGAAQLRWIAASGGESHEIVPVSQGYLSPSFNSDGTRVYYMEDTRFPEGPEGKPARLLRSVRLDGVDKKAHMRFEGRLVEAIPSPDDQWVALEDKYDAYLVAFPLAGTQTIAITLQGSAVPVKRVTTEGAKYLSWADGGKTLTWSFGTRFYRVARDTVLQAEKREDWKPEEAEISLDVPRALPRGSFVLRGARLVTMNGKEVIERGDILVENNRVKAVGAAGKIDAPRDAKIFDLKGKTVIPGFVDIHSHMGSQQDVMTDQDWPYAANLAYGVTTTRDPSNDSSQVFAQGELVEAGELVGPRIYSTGTPMVTSLATIGSQEDADNIVKRYIAQGSTSLKQYMQPRRIQREWLGIAAAKEGVNITAEGGGDLKLDLSMALDGYTGFEHSLGIVPLYKDVIELLAQAKTTYTPTLIVAYGGPFGQLAWRQKMDIHDDPKVMRFTPHDVVDRRARWRMLLLDDEYHFPLIARGAAEVQRRGGNVALGSHGEQQGIGAHWELWMLQSGGMTPWETLHCATMLGAESIGLDKELGSIEPGKLADLVVLNSNPLDNIQNSRDIRYLIKNGVVYEADTLDEVWPLEKKFPPFFWRSSDGELTALPK